MTTPLHSQTTARPTVPTDQLGPRPHARSTHPRGDPSPPSLGFRWGLGAAPAWPASLSAASAWNAGRSGGCRFLHARRVRPAQPPACRRPACGLQFTPACPLVLAARPDPCLRPLSSTNELGWPCLVVAARLLFYSLEQRSIHLLPGVRFDALATATCASQLKLHISARK